MTYNVVSDKPAYGLIREEYFLGDGSRIAYGVAAYAHPTSTGNATVVASVHDITTDRSAALRLVSRCNRGHLSPEHLADVVYDLLGSLT